MASISQEGSHTLADQHQVYTRTWKPSITPKSYVLFLHGFSDHINRFDVFLETLASRGILVHAFDQRGWGRSVTKKSQKGLTGPTSTVMDDISSVLRSIIPEAKELSVPLFLMGHSMGGAETLYYAATGPADIRKEIRGYLGLAPYLTLHPSAQPSRALLISGRFAAKIFPQMQMVQKLKSDSLCRDPEIAKTWEADELCHDTGTLSGLAGMIDRGAELDAGTTVVKEGSIYVAHGSGDLVTNHDASKRFVEKLQVEDKIFKSYDGWYHVLHGEPGEDKIQYANDVAEWILARTNLDPPNESAESKTKL